MAFNSLRMYDWLRADGDCIKRPCIGCLRPVRKWGVTSMTLMEQFCSKRCETAFFKGYDLGLGVLNSISRWPKMGERPQSGRGGH